VLTSKFEGFPNALCEAMANGCACISYDCPTGPSELIDDGVNGILVEPENTGAFAAALSALMKDDVRMNRLSAEAVKITRLLDEDKIMDQWEKLLDEVLQLNK
jgi:glycosyltransferase involved in cell wall biosynthesis